MPFLRPTVKNLLVKALVTITPRPIYRVKRPVNEATHEWDLQTKVPQAVGVVLEPAWSENTGVEALDLARHPVTRDEGDDGVEDHGNPASGSTEEGLQLNHNAATSPHSLEKDEERRFWAYKEASTPIHVRIYCEGMTRTPA